MKFVNENGIPVPLLADPDKKVAKAYGASAPVVGTRRAVIIVGEDGKVAYKHVHTLGLDFQTVDDIREALAKV
jgi:peroxiredoxin Q/BCP